MSSASSGGEAIADSVPNLGQGETVTEASSGSDQSSHFVSEDDPLYQLRPQLTTEASQSIDPARRKSATSEKQRNQDAIKRQRESSSRSEYQPPGPLPKKKKTTKKTKLKARKEGHGGDPSEPSEIEEEDESADEADPQVEFLKSYHG